MGQITRNALARKEAFYEGFLFDPPFVPPRKRGGDECRTGVRRSRGRDAGRRRYVTNNGSIERFVNPRDGALETVSSIAPYEVAIL